MNVHAPDCDNVEDLLVFGDIRKGVISQGIKVEVPDLQNLEPETIDALEDDFRTFLANLREGERLQVQYYKGADYHRELERFRKVTETSSACRLSKRQRTERYERYLSRMHHDRLIQSELRFFLSAKVLCTIQFGRSK